MTPPPGATRFLVPAAGAVIEVHAAGAGVPMVLVPSLGRGAGDLAPLADGLAATGVRVLRPQPRGAGGSTGRMTGLTYADWAGDLAAVIEAAGGGPAVLVGHAAGGRYARACAARYPHLVAAVVLAAVAARHPPAHLAADLACAADPTRPHGERAAAVRRAFLAPAVAVGPGPPPAHPDTAGWLRGWYPRTLAAQRATRPDRGWCSAGAAPVLDLIGAGDAWRPAASHRELVELLGPRVTVRVIPGAGHALPTEQPRAAAAAIGEWLGAAGGGRR
jgi:pimeloyl-ACP methyl ester carboxylesterase